MIVYKKVFIMLSILVFLIMYTMFFPKFTSALVSSEVLDFGDVTVNTSKIIPLNITNFYEFYSMEVMFVFKKEGNCNSSVFSVEQSDLIILAKDTLHVNIHYTPTDFQECSDYLRIFYSADDGEGQQDILDLLVRGTGIEEQIGTETLSLSEFFESHVDAGTLEGTGKNERTGKKSKTAKRRLKKMRRMLEHADKYIENGQTKRACKKLKRIYKSCDGKRKKDLVKGEATGELAEMVNNFATNLECKWIVGRNDGDSDSDSDSD